ncbi:MAG: tripartite tricarboxylate transporter substrate binding protein, partial [Hylemonella sp.]|nr:tripartite tricarboxylate transporter substrate binding protein [Hylemonella sp.]
GWLSGFLPGGTPKPIVDRLSGESQKIVRSPERNSGLVGMGLKPVGGTPEELAGVMTRDLPRWSKIVRDAKITLE